MNVIRVEANRELCQGYGNCVVAAPDVFDLDDDGVVEVMRAEIDDSERLRVDESVRSCPVAALRLVQAATSDH